MRVCDKVMSNLSAMQFVICLKVNRNMMQSCEHQMVTEVWAHQPHLSRSTPYCCHHHH